MQLSGDFIESINHMAKQVHQNAVDHGFYDPEPSGAERIALMHSELSEALEFMRHGNPPDDHIPKFSGVEAEMADVVIRVLDYCQHMGYRIGEAIVAKHEYNKTRPFRHGGKNL